MLGRATHFCNPAHITPNTQTAKILFLWILSLEIATFYKQASRLNEGVFCKHLVALWGLFQAAVSRQGETKRLNSEIYSSEIFFFIALLFFLAPYFTMYIYHLYSQRFSMWINVNVNKAILVLDGFFNFRAETIILKQTQKKEKVFCQQMWNFSDIFC